MMDNPIAKLLLKFAGLGTGMTFGFVLLEMWKTQPGALVQLATSWGPLAMIVFAGMWFGDRRIGEGIQVMRDNTAAQQQLATAVTQIAQRDDERGIALELVTSKSARDIREALDQLHDIRQHLGISPEKAHGHTAGQ